MLEMLGFEVDLAASGREAIEALGRAAYDAVLMDCQLPGMDGFETTAEIRRREGASRRTPIIALTTLVSPQDRERCFSAGMDGHVAKPAHAGDLQAVLERWSGHRAPRASTEAGAAPREGASQEGPLDPSVLAGLRELQIEGRPEFAAEVAAIFLQEAPARVAALRETVSRGDAQALARAAHALKGSSANVGARRLAFLCGELEAMGRSRPTPAAAKVLRRLEQELDRVRAALESMGVREQ